MDNLTSKPITDTSSTQQSPDSINEQKINEQKTNEKKITTPETAVGGDKQTESSTNDVVKENKEIKAI